MLEQTRRVDTIVLDKTGTVTEGKLELAGVALLERRRPGRGAAARRRGRGRVRASGRRAVVARRAARSSATLPPRRGLPEPPGIGVAGSSRATRSTVGRERRRGSTVVLGRRAARATLERRATRVKPTSAEAVARAARRSA